MTPEEAKKLKKGDRIIGFDQSWVGTMHKGDIEVGSKSLRGAPGTIVKGNTNTPYIKFDEGVGWLKVNKNYGGADITLNPSQLYPFQGPADYLAYAMIQNGYPVTKYEEVRAAATMVHNTLLTIGVDIPGKDSDPLVKAVEPEATVFCKNCLHQLKPHSSIAGKWAKASNGNPFCPKNDEGPHFPSGKKPSQQECYKCANEITVNDAGFWEALVFGKYDDPLHCSQGGPHVPAVPQPQLVKEADPELEKLLAEEEEIDAFAKQQEAQSKLNAKADQFVVTYDNGHVITVDKVATAKAIEDAGLSHPSSMASEAASRWFKERMSHKIDDDDKAEYLVQAFRDLPGHPGFALINSIKELRANMNLGLKEAKDMIEKAKAKILKDEDVF